MASKTISEILNCGICGKLLNEPRVIPCSHSFCSLCISQTLYSTIILQTQQQEEEDGAAAAAAVEIKFRCPICLSEHQNLQIATYLPRNHFLENILHSLPPNHSSDNDNNNTNNNTNNNNRKKQIIRYCENNDSHIATIYCAECEAYLCSSCFKSLHVIGKLKQHTPQSSDDFKTAITSKPNHACDDESPKCSKHPKYQKDLYCESCQSPICQMCWVDNHNNDNNNTKHKVTSAAKYAEQIKSKLLQRCDLILENTPNLYEEIYYTSEQIIDLQNKIADLQKQLEIKLQKKSNLQNKINDIISTHQIITTAINQYFTESDLINKQIVNHCTADISIIHRKLNSFKPPLPIINLDPLAIPDEMWSLSKDSIKGDPSSCTLISNKHFEKLNVGYCGISCKESIKHTSASAHYQWQIQYLPIDAQGWLLIGLYSKFITSTRKSYKEPQFVGWNITRISYSNNGSWFYGKCSANGRLQVESGDILKFSFNTKSKTIRLEHPSWHVETTLQSHFDHYYLHFNSHSASFKLLSCSLLLD